MDGLGEYFLMTLGSGGRKSWVDSVAARKKKKKNKEKEERMKNKRRKKEREWMSEWARWNREKGESEKEEDWGRTRTVDTPTH